MNRDDLEDLAESLVPVAARLVGIVHDDGPGAVARLLSTVPPAHLPALAIVLAAMVNPDRTPRELLAWVDWEHPPPQDTLFTVAAAVDVEGLGDEQLRYGHARWRKRVRGTLSDDATASFDRAAFLEWERRRAADYRVRREASPPGA